MNKSKILIVLLALVFIFGNIATVAAYYHTDEEIYFYEINEYYTSSSASLTIVASSAPVTTIVELRAAIDAAPTDGTPTIIELAEDVTMPTGAAGNQIIIGNGIHIILTGGNNGYAIIRAAAGQRHFRVDNGGTLQLQNITINGSYPTITGNHGGIEINAGGHLIMEDGSEITNNRNGTGSHGGGITVRGIDAQFTLNGGKISGNSGGSGAGGVFVGDGAVFTMIDGEISNNTVTANSAAGVFVQGVSSQFIMSGGVIRNNIGRFGGGVRIGASALIPSALPTLASAPSMYMDGGEIYENIAFFGGGVNLEWGLFTMSGGIIHRNRATALSNPPATDFQHNRGGGGVFVQNSGIFSMEGGNIYRNHSYNHGGGVKLLSNTTFTMTGGIISGNTAVNNGGGVAAALINASGNPLAGAITATITNGTIAGNTAVNGGGAWLTTGNNTDGTGSVLVMSAGTIKNNTATNDGGGIWLDTFNYNLTRGARLNMTGGTISNNRAENNGGGIFTSSHNYVDPLPTPNAYPNILPRDSFPGIILGNTAGGGQFKIPSNYNVLPFGHLLNNYQINYISSTQLWTISFEVEDSAHGNIAGESISSDVFVTDEYPIVPSVNEETGWQFIGWVLYGGDQNEILTYQDIEAKPVVANARFIARFVQVHNVIFNLHGGANAANFPLQQVLDGGYSVRPASNPTRQGFEFIGWSSINDNAMLFDFENTPITENTVIHALWKQLTTTPPQPPSTPNNSPGGGSTPHARPPALIPPEQKPGQVFTHRPYIFGFPDGTMQPNGFLTRAQVAQIYFNLSNNPNKYAAFDTPQNIFHDVIHGDWYFNAVFYAKQNGIITGFPDGYFRPNDYITNAELSTFIARAFAPTAEERFAHESIISHWARRYVAITFHPFWISYFGEDYIFAPDDDISRAQAVTLLNNFLGRIPSQSGIDAYLDGRQLFIDLNRYNHWAFYELMEAHILHDFMWSENYEQEIWQ